jgi:CheY-like chemotaxis protein
VSDTGTTTSASVLLAVADRPTEAAVRQTFATNKIQNALQVVHDGSAALAYLHRSAAARPDLVLLHMPLPGLDGRLVLREIRNDARLADIAVVVLTGSAAEERHLRQQRLPADGYVQPPFDLDALGRILREVDRLGLVVSRKRVPGRSPDSGTMSPDLILGRRVRDRDDDSPDRTG